MLHILLLILKWIGIVLFAFLTLVILIISLGLFVPFRYQTDISYQNDIETLEAEFSLSWLWKLFLLRVCWKEGKTAVKMRIGWKSFFTANKENEESKAKGGVSEEIGSKKEQEAGEVLKGQEKIDAGQEDATESLEDKKERDLQKSEPYLSLPENAVQKQAENPEREERRKTLADKQLKAERKRKESLWTRIKRKVFGWKKSCEEFWRKLLAIGRNVRGKKEQVGTFLTDASHRRAFASVKREVVLIFRELSPRNGKIVAKIGLEDPYLTGQALAVLGILFPFLGENTVIVPDFEKKVLEGSIHAEGKIHNFRMAAILWRLVKDRDVRKIIIDIKKLKW